MNLVIVTVKILFTILTLWITKKILPSLTIALKRSIDVIDVILDSQQRPMSPFPKLMPNSSAGIGYHRQKDMRNWATRWNTRYEWRWILADKWRRADCYQCWWWVTGMNGWRWDWWRVRINFVRWLLLRKEARVHLTMSNRCRFILIQTNCATLKRLL